jgi:hypothetical protein
VCLGEMRGKKGREEEKKRCEGLMAAEGGCICARGDIILVNVG